MRDEYNKDYRKREYDKFSGLEPQRERKKPSFLTLLLVGLLVLLVCSLGYDNIIKPYLEKKEQPVYSLSIVAAMAIILFLTGKLVPYGFVPGGYSVMIQPFFATAL